MRGLGAAVVVGKHWIKVLPLPPRDAEHAEDDSSQYAENHEQ